MLVVQTLRSHGGDVMGYTVIIDGKSGKNFRELVQRATNLWPDAPAEIKEFADQITNNGWVMQDYASQDTSLKPTKKEPNVN